MTEPMTLLGLAGFGFAGLGVAVYASLKGWQGWLDLKRLELTGSGARDGRVTTGDRIEIADLRERVRKLEAIASCVDL